MFLNKGVDVFLEKPIAITFDHAHRLSPHPFTKVRPQERIPSTISSVHHRARTQIRSGKIGAIQSIRYSKNVQRQGDESSHALDTLAIHGIDLAEFLLDGQTPLRISEVVGSRTSCALTLEYPNQVEISIDVGWEAEVDVAELEVIGRNGRILVQLQQHEHYEILKDHSTIQYVQSNHTPLEAVLLDFLRPDSASIAAPTGSILRTIKCVEQARLQLTAQGRSKTRELKR